MRLKALLIEQGMWSQYLEVGIGPDAEIFTAGRQWQPHRHSPRFSGTTGTGSGAAVTAVARSMARPWATM
jgi:hypothetical protein